MLDRRENRGGKERGTVAKKKKVRLIDVAREANVSLATVDRTVNGREGVRNATAEKIWEIYRRLESDAEVSRPRSAWQTPLRFDFVLPPGPNTFMSMLNESIQAARSGLDRFGVQVNTHHIEGFNVPMLAEAIRTVRESSDGIVVKAIENPVIREVVNQTVDSGVPVVTLVSDLSNTRRIEYVGLDNVAAGRTAGYLMGRFASTREGPVALLAGSIALNYRDHQEREYGFRDALAEHFSGLGIVAREETHDDSVRAQSITAELLRRHPDLVGIYNIGGGSRGVGQALRESGRWRDIVFIGHELTRFARHDLIDGVMDALINQDVTHEVSEAIRVLLQHYQRHPPSPPLGRPRIEVFLRENLP